MTSLHVKIADQSEGHFSESSRSLGKVMRYSVVGREAPSPVVSFSSSVK